MNLKKINKEEFGKFLTPERIYKFKFREELEKIYEKLYYDNFNYLLVSNFFFISIILSLFIYISMYPQLYVWLNTYYSAGFTWALFTTFIIYFTLNLVVYYSVLSGYLFYNYSIHRKNEAAIEKDLPEFIDNLISNLKGGISLEKALLKSVRKDQKILLKEISLINEKIFMGMGVADAIKDFMNRYDSPVISRTLFLITEGMGGGGNLTKPLETISKNLKKIYELNDEIKANSSGFAVVITSITIVVSPLLFALALTLLNFIGNLFALLAETENQMLMVTSIPPEYTMYLQNFSYAMIVLITFFSSLISAQLKNEKIYESLKYLPFYIVIALVLYWQFSKILLSFFGGILG